MREYIENVVIKNPIGNLYRRNHVLVLLARSDGGFVLCKKKNFYPDHIARMLGGAIGENEDPLLAAQREIKEELQADIPIDDFAPLCVVITHAKTTEGPMEMKTHIFAARIDSKIEVKPGDDISGIQIYSPKQYRELVEAMNELTGEYVTEAFSFQWSDWGKIYAPIHAFAMDEYLLFSNAHAH